MIAQILAALVVLLFIPAIVIIVVKAAGETWAYSIKAFFVTLAVIVLTIVGFGSAIFLCQEPERPVVIQAEHP